MNCRARHSKFPFLLLRSDFASAIKVGLTDATSLRGAASWVYVPLDDHALVPAVMALEGAGIIIPDCRYDSIMPSFDGKQSQYLRDTPWVLAEDFRLWLTSVGYTPFKP